MGPPTSRRSVVKNSPRAKPALKGGFVVPEVLPKLQPQLCDVEGAADPGLMSQPESPCPSPVQDCQDVKKTDVQKSRGGNPMGVANGEVFPPGGNSKKPRELGPFLPYKTRPFLEAYELGDPIGRGTYGEVWVCYERLLTPASGSSRQSLNRTFSVPPVLRSLPSLSVSVHSKRGVADVGPGGVGGLRAPARGTSEKERVATSTGKEGLRGREFACKVVCKSSLKSRTRVEDLRREIAVLKLFAGMHPGIVQLHEVLEGESTIKIIMEYCRGGDLFDLLRTCGPLPEQGAKILFLQLASAVAFCHKHGVLHRDIKPENVLFTADPVELYQPRHPSEKLPAVEVKLADFGLSAILESPHATVSGFTGSRYYTAPEMVQGQQYGTGADVWSLGVVLFVILTGRLPFAGLTDDDHAGIKAAILTGRLNFELPFWDGVSESAKDLVQGMLQVDSNDRLHLEEVLSHHWLKSPAERLSKLRDKQVKVLNSATQYKTNEGSSKRSKAKTKQVMLEMS